MSSACDTLLSNHRSQEPVKCDSDLSNHDSNLAYYDRDLSDTIQQKPSHPFFGELHGNIMNYRLMNFLIVLTIVILLNQNRPVIIVYDFQLLTFYSISKVHQAIISFLQVILGDTLIYHQAR